MRSEKQRWLHHCFKLVSQVGDSEIKVEEGHGHRFTRNFAEKLQKASDQAKFHPARYPPARLGALPKAEALSCRVRL
jgi:hypothetical protein